MKKYKNLIIVSAVLAAMLLGACGEAPIAEIPANDYAPVAVAPAKEAKPEAPVVEETPDAGEETDIPEVTQPAIVGDPQENIDEFGYIKKIQKASEESGIYSLILYFNDTVPDKGEIKVLFYSDETGFDTQVAIYQAQYERSNGLYEIHTFLDNLVDVNYHGKDELKIPITFGATVRAKRAEIFFVDSAETPLTVVYSD